MKDPDRIDEILKLISKIWHKHPNLRLCQIIGNLFIDKDLYYIEDDVLQDRLEKKYS